MTVDAIFIVDDNPNNLSLLTGILRGAGYEVRVANRGRRALAAIQLEPPALIMLDINMPDLSGYALCEQLKADATTAGIPIIFLSALNDVENKVTAFQVGGADYVTKPFHAEEVLARVANHLRIARMQRLLEERNQQLARRNDELEAAWRSADHAFEALSDVLPGKVLDGKYSLEAKIGKGGFSAIYRARHLQLDKPVAVKVLRLDHGREAQNLVERFRQEGMSATRVSHPNAVAILDSGVTSAGIAYLVMELLEGRSLGAELEACGALSLERCAQILAPVCDMLATAHAGGLVHRDIKPANIFLHQPPTGEVVKVVDFGIATFFNRSRETAAMTTIGSLVGTPVYMSPERLQGGAYDGRADTYSVGMTLYEMIAGRLPFDPPTDNLSALILACLYHEPRPLGSFMPRVPASIDAVIQQALHKDPAQRPHIHELAAQLTAAIAALPELLRTAPDLVELVDPRLWSRASPTTH
ncbi:MAG: protein kinase [Deltaproteobacteria bacterium]|nr:protein kinase [Deltaproteobacteria bacterium]